MTSPSAPPLIPASLKEASLLRKVAKMLGLKATAGGDRVVRELQRRVGQRVAEQQAAAARGTVLRAPPDLAALQAALDQVVALRPVARELADHASAGPIALPQALQFLRERSTNTGSAASAESQPAHP